MKDPGYLFEMPPCDLRRAARTFKQFEKPVWTESKANLIQRYLKGFVFVTKHGTYIDAFAGPQRLDQPELWAAKLVVETEPRWLRNFFFFEENQKGLSMLNKLISDQPSRIKGEPKRTFKVYAGDFNVNIHSLLDQFPIKDQEATFCLLDQRCFECDWASVEAVAGHKKGGNKIELFYFLPHAWLERSVSGLANREAEMNRWWGDSSWKRLIERKGYERGKYAADRFKADFGYKDAYSYPIYGRSDGGRTLYFMVHASDHEAAQGIMFRAYKHAVGAVPKQEQINMKLVNR